MVVFVVWPSGKGVGWWFGGLISWFGEFGFACLDRGKEDSVEDVERIHAAANISTSPIHPQKTQDKSSLPATYQPLPVAGAGV
jgi:hypothetical protein